ncbi:FAD-dependent oxidoreductase [Shewanella sp. AS1]|uniref:glycerol-3-phosphate dehydrogenase/oxidase n=1 Tax=Shewanella sp. AS1 TaxID=2907626 RepID=UPI001F1DC818|nr:FAD-dependent oxidoreductase [Shewanella sp. AS1]MCE9677753.1 FAD-dependent oxidoreductase [Shewanella sp. AS1]
MEAVDIVIIGGGITGVGIAQRAQASGYRVVLLERGALGEQTSANSSKLIHGGLRYLESGQLNLVRQSLAERRALLSLAPDLVKAVPFYIPIYEGNQRGPMAIRAGLSLYALLSELDPLGYFNRIHESQWPSLGIKLTGLQAVFRYFDAQTDDHQLTLAVAQSAAELGAKIMTQVELQQIAHDSSGCVLTYLQSESSEEKQLFAKCVINATGPWVNQTLARVTPTPAPIEISLVQGSHLLLDIAPPPGILYLESIYDKRVVFVIPWEGQTLLGTTETQVDSPEQAGVTMEETDYLLGIYSHYFPYYSIDQLKQKLTGTYCGMRVLPKLGGAAFDRPRETLMHSLDTHPQLLSIYGGKLTTFRHTAKEAVQWVKERIGARPIKADVDTLRLKPPGGAESIKSIPRDDFLVENG